MPVWLTTRVLLAALPLGVGVALAAAGRASPPLLGIGGVWLLWVAIREWAKARGDPKTWGGNPVLRGLHPARCALLVEVDDADAARELARWLHARGVGATFFAPAGNRALAAELREAGFEVGSLGPAEDGSLWRSVADRPTARELGGGGTLVGHSIRLTPRSTELEAERVVGTDLVVIRASTPPHALACWLENWERRAVHPSRLRDVMAT